MNKIDGKKIAGEIVEKLKEKEKPEKILAAVYVGSNPASEAFLKVKEKAAKELGVDFRVYSFSESISGEKLREEVGRISKMGVAGGVIVQLPLPDKFNKQKILNAVDLEKDVDAYPPCSKRAIAGCCSFNFLARACCEYLDLILSVGYRVNSSAATQFRIWATKTLKQHLVKGYTINKKRLLKKSRHIFPKLRRGFHTNPL